MRKIKKLTTEADAGRLEVNVGEADLDVAVNPGKLTEATIRHKGAEVTLKLVEEEGGEALANTQWTVLTPAGDVLHNSVGAFPSIILAEGSYTVYARHGETNYTRDFEGDLFRVGGPVLANDRGQTKTAGIKAQWLARYLQMVVL